jgi:predicted nuclease of predicted toxin-antitoxin system
MAVFVVDDQLPAKLASRLRGLGHEAWHVREIGLDEASDDAIAAEAGRRSAIIVTKDADFITRSALGKLKSPVLWIRIGNVANDVLWRFVEPWIGEALSAFQIGDRVFEIRRTPLPPAPSSPISRST